MVVARHTEFLYLFVSLIGYATLADKKQLENLNCSKQRDSRRDPSERAVHIQIALISKTIVIVKPIYNHRAPLLRLKTRGGFPPRSGHTLRMGHSIPAGSGSISISDRGSSKKARKLSRAVCGVADSKLSCREYSQSNVWELRTAEGIPV